MTLDEAIRIKNLTGDAFLTEDPDEIDEADRLSIEALKLLQRYRKTGHVWASEKLPGETKE